MTCRLPSSSSARTAAATSSINFAKAGTYSSFSLLDGPGFRLGLAMGVGQFIGAQIGSRFAMKNGAKIIRPLLVLSCLAMAMKLLVDASSAWSIATIWETIFPK